MLQLPLGTYLVEFTAGMTDGATDTSGSSSQCFLVGTLDAGASGYYYDLNGQRFTPGVAGARGTFVMRQLLTTSSSGLGVICLGSGITYSQAVLTATPVAASRIR
jgi:hypothetical protein